MAQDDALHRKPRATAAVVGQGRAGAAPEFAASSARIQRQLSEWALAEVAPGRLLPWLPVAFGLGVVVYFTADHEPAWWAALPLAIAVTLGAVAARRRAFGFPLLLGLAGISVGFAVATLQTTWLAHPVLPRTVWSASLSGFVEKREERERSDRITLRIHHLEGPRVTVKPERVRLAVRKGTAPAVGSFVTLKAHLSPPLAPLRPGGYDFGRDMYFLRIGASGYALGAIAAAPPSAPPTPWLRYAAFLDSIRDAIDRRIRAVLPGDRGSIASALITGKRDAITAPVNDAMYISSLAHVLSISGYHMAVVAGIAFFFLRAGLALVPALASTRPIKKWAALGALIAAALYLVLSGSEVATQRSFIMIAIVLIGVMADRPALTFRTLTVAALCVLLLAPESVVQPSFQMSFAATLALIAAYQHGLPWKADADSSLSARVALWGGRELIGLVLASLVAGLATTPYAAYHFHRLAPYGVLANLLAMPVVSALVMPMGILGVLVMPFGFDEFFWRAMGVGLDWMIAVALWVAHLPGAVGRIQAFGTGPLLLGTAGLLLICLLRTPLRVSGVLLAIAACVWAGTSPRPDVLVANDGRAAALRGPDGRLVILFNSRDAFTVKEWLAADGDPRDGKDPSLQNGVTCDGLGCLGRLADGRFVSFARSLEALAEDCARAAVVVSEREAKAPCAATVIDRKVWREKGALALRVVGGRCEESAARPVGFDRPWGRGPASEVVPAVAPANPADATPPQEALEADDQ